MRICVFGASNSSIPAVYMDFAEELGIKLAKSNIGLVFGAGRTGLMGAAARGAFGFGGEIIGVIPKKLNVPGIFYENCTEIIETETMHERKSIMEGMSDGFIALSGGFGTIEELMEVITLKQLGYHDLPIVIVNVNGFYDNLLKQFASCVDEGFTNADYLGLFTVAKTVDEAITQVVNYRHSSMPDKMSEAIKSHI